MSDRILLGDLALVCTKCGTEIQCGTNAEMTNVCIPCADGRSLFDDDSRNVRRFHKRLDRQLIQITRLSQSTLHADYEVTSTLWDIDPRFRSRNIKVGSVTGILRIDKGTGEIYVVYPIAFDDDGGVLLKAKRVLSKAFEKGEFPVKTGWASS